jgi:hypothetical protein
MAATVYSSRLSVARVQAAAMLEIRRGTGYPWARRGLAGLDTCSVTRIWSGRHPGSAGPLPLLLSVSHLLNQRGFLHSRRLKGCDAVLISAFQRPGWYRLPGSEAVPMVRGSGPRFLLPNRAAGSYSGRSKSGTATFPRAGSGGVRRNWEGRRVRRVRVAQMPLFVTIGNR